MATNRHRTGAARTQFAVVLASILGSFLGLAARPCHPASRIPKVDGHWVGTLRSDADGSETGWDIPISSQRGGRFRWRFGELARAYPGTIDRDGVISVHCSSGRGFYSTAFNSHGQLSEDRGTLAGTFYRLVIVERRRTTFNGAFTITRMGR